MTGEKEETGVVREALAYLPMKFHGCKVWRANSGGNKSGRRRANSINLPDICGVQRYGMSLFVEVKTAVGRLTRAQHAFLREMHERGAASGVYSPAGFFHFDAIPEQHMPRGAK